MNEKKNENRFMKRMRTEASHIFPTPIVNILAFFYKKYKKFRMPEEHKSYGSLYPDRTFYVIRIYPPGTGFLANYNYILGYMNYAKENGWIPIIDMQNYETIYTDSISNDDNTNIWELFFMQPYDEIHECRYSLSEVYQSQNVILSCGSEDFYDSSFNERVITLQRDLCRLIPFNASMQEYADSIYKDTFRRISHPVLGLPLRGTDYNTHKAGHDIQLPLADVPDVIEKYSKLWYPNSRVSIYINSEEYSTIEFLSSKIPNIVSAKTHRLSNYSASTIGDAVNSTDAFKMLRDYLANIYIMSKCDALIGTMNNGFYTAFLWSYGDLKHFERIDLGKHI